MAYFRLSSATIAVALAVLPLDTLPPDFEDYRPAIVEELQIPANIKRNLRANIKPYLQDIELLGYEKKIVRKMMLVGNSGI